MPTVGLARYHISTRRFVDADVSVMPSRNVSDCDPNVTPVVVAGVVPGE